jgi:hypothetical protein
VILLVVLVVVIGLPVVGVYLAVNYVGRKAEDLVGAGECTLISNSDASDALGAPITLQKGTGLGRIVSGVIDGRILEGAPSCWGTTETTNSSDLATLVRIAVQEKGDAAAAYQEEVRRAKGVVTQDNRDADGNGTTVTTGSYYGNAVSGLGDEAFCTSLGLTGTVGVLVRQGDKLVYSAVGADLQSLGVPDPSADPSGIKLPDGAATCERAQKLARILLR